MLRQAAVPSLGFLATNVFARLPGGTAACSRVFGRTGPIGHGGLATGGALVAAVAAPPFEPAHGGVGAQAPAAAQRPCALDVVEQRIVELVPAFPACPPPHPRACLAAGVPKWRSKRRSAAGRAGAGRGQGSSSTSTSTSTTSTNNSTSTTRAVPVPAPAAATAAAAAAGAGKP